MGDRTAYAVKNNDHTAAGDGLLTDNCDTCTVETTDTAKPINTDTVTEDRELTVSTFTVVYPIPVTGKGKGRVQSIERLLVKYSCHKSAQVWHAVSKNHTFSLPPTHLSTNGMNHTWLLSRSQLFTDTGGMEG